MVGRSQDRRQRQAARGRHQCRSEAATYTDAIGAPQLATGWTDPDFKPGERAFYYARVLEIPTPRWNTYDAVRFEMAPLTKVPATIQERAWSSPIWYTPG